MASENEVIKPVIGQWADYLDTGIWTVKDGVLTPPPDLTESQLRDFQAVFGELTEGQATEKKYQRFYVSLTRDLQGVYLMFEAESADAVRQHLEREYLRVSVWLLPWHEIYTEEPTEQTTGGKPVHIVDRTFHKLQNEVRY